MLLLLETSCVFNLDRPRPGSDLPRPEARLEDRSSIDSALPDLASDGPRPDQSCPTELKKVDAEADSLLSSSAADQSYGDKPIANIGSGIGSRGVLRFPVPSGSLRSLKLRVLPVVNDADCGAPCKSCAAIEKAGSLDLHYLVSNWVETEVTWNQKNKAAKIDWEVAGAGGPGDRSASVLTASFTAGKELVFEITRPDSLTLAEKWRAGNKLSFLLVPHQGTVLVAATREQASKGCQPDVVAPSLEISSCK